MGSKKWLERLDEAGSRLSQAAWELNHIDELCTYPESCEAVNLRFYDAITDVFLCCFELHFRLQARSLLTLWKQNGG